MRTITVKFAKRCDLCHDFVPEGAGAVYDPETKRLWHVACRPEEEMPPEGDGPAKLAEQLGFE